jgi:hypothetical protein
VVTGWKRRRFTAKAASRKIVILELDMTKHLSTAQRKFRSISDAFFMLSTELLLSILYHKLIRIAQELNFKEGIQKPLGGKYRVFEKMNNNGDKFGAFDSEPNAEDDNEAEMAENNQDEFNSQRKVEEQFESVPSPMK